MSGVILQFWVLKYFSWCWQTVPDIRALKTGAFCQTSPQVIGLLKVLSLTPGNNYFLGFCWSQEDSESKDAKITATLWKQHKDQALEYSTNSFISCPSSQER